MSSSEMKASEILERVIPRGKAQMVARFMGVSDDYVRRWRREIPSHGNDDSTGMKSPVDKTCDLIDICILFNRKDTPLIAEVINSHLQSVIESETSDGFLQITPGEAAAELLRTSAEAVNSLKHFRRFRRHAARAGLPARCVGADARAHASFTYACH